MTANCLNVQKILYFFFGKYTKKRENATLSLKVHITAWVNFQKIYAKITHQLSVHFFSAFFREKMPLTILGYLYSQKGKLQQIKKSMK